MVLIDVLPQPVLAENLWLIFEVSAHHLQRVFLALVIVLEKQELLASGIELELSRGFLVVGVVVALAPVLVNLQIAQVVMLIGGKLAQSMGMPADPMMRMDGVEFMPTNRNVLFGYQFKSIAGAGPIVGPIIAIQWGWLPALLWILAGALALMVAVGIGLFLRVQRHQDRSAEQLREAREALAQARGQLAEARHQLEKLAEVNRLGVEAEWEFNEWLHGETGNPMGYALQAWSAGMFIYAYETVRAGRVPMFAELSATHHV